MQEYNELNEDNVEIRVIGFDTIGRLVEEVLSEAEANTKLYDGFVVPPLAIGDIDAAGGLKDLTEFVANDETVQWFDNTIFFRCAAPVRTAAPLPLGKILTHSLTHSHAGTWRPSTTARSCPSRWTATSF